MNLPPSALRLQRLLVKDKLVLALDTGFEAESIEGLRLVKASRGSGWFYHAGTLSPWTTRGVTQDGGRLVVWGDLAEVPEGTTPEHWPRTGDEGREFFQAFVIAWTARSRNSDPLEAFSPTSIVPYRTAAGWSFAFLPPELRGVLGSIQPLAGRLVWDHFRLPEATGVASWAFTSAALAWDQVEGNLPWTQDEEAHLRQEIRDLRKTLSEAELPGGPDPETLKLWFESLTGRVGTHGADRWSRWAQGSPSWMTAPLDPVRAQKRAAATARRTRRRNGATWWRRRGTLTLTVIVGLGLVLAVVGSVVWNAVKPYPQETWTPEQVVRGYYEALQNLDSEVMDKLTAFDKDRQQELTRDHNEATNLFVIRQVRMGYEQKNPVLVPEKWEAQGRPALTNGQMLFGLAGLEVSGADREWTARYRKWISDAEEGQAPHAVGTEVSDRLTLAKTDRGWKITALDRTRRPLP